MTTAMLTITKDAAEQQGLFNMNIVQGDAEGLSFYIYNVDIVLFHLACFHFPNPKHWFSEMARVLRSGGSWV